MNDENITSVIADKGTEKKSYSEKPKVSKADKRLEKLTLLKEKYAKASAAKDSAVKKAENIGAQIEKIEKEIHAEEIAEIDKLCAEKGLTYGDIASILKSIPNGMTAEDVKNLFV